MFSVKVTGLQGVEFMAERMAVALSPVALTAVTVTLAKEAGHALHAATVRACIEAIYDQPEGLSYDRTQALLDAHRIVDHGLVQAVDIDPNATVRSEAHPGREFVDDYAGYVHDGYTQWLFGRETGEFMPGKFWMDRAGEEASPVIFGFIAKAFEKVIEEIALEVTR